MPNLLAHGLHFWAQLHARITSVLTVLPGLYVLPTQWPLGPHLHLLVIHTSHSSCSSPLAFLNTQVWSSSLALPCCSVCLVHSSFGHLNGSLPYLLQVFASTSSSQCGLPCLTLTLLLPQHSLFPVWFFSASLISINILLFFLKIYLLLFPSSGWNLHENRDFGLFLYSDLSPAPSTQYLAHDTYIFLKS